MRGNIPLAVLASFLLSFSFLIIFLNYYTDFDELEQWKSDFFSQSFTSEKKIILLGASQVGRLNSTYIQDYLEENGEFYSIYNLAIAADRPQNRITSIDKILKLNPDFVIYGIGFRDFEQKNKPQFNLPSSNMPDPKELIEKTIILNSFTDYDFGIFESPKVDTLKFIRNFGHREYELSELLYETNTPFYHPIKNPKQPVISEQGLIEEVSATSFNGIKSYDYNIDVLALEKIIQKLHENKIKIIIFTTPYNEYYLNAAPESYHNFMNSMLKIISEKYDIKIYKLHDRYNGQHDIWYDYTHIAIDEEITIFNNDISELILNELD